MDLMVKKNEDVKKYYYIQTLRFVFCVMIINYHFYATFLRQQEALPNFFCRGYLADEFFFMLSGFFFARTVANDNQSTKADYSIKYVFSRIKQIAIPYYVSWILCFCGGRIKDYLDGEQLDIIPKLLNSIYELCFLEMFGFNNGLYSNSVGWYFRALILSILIICPLIGRYRMHYVYNIAPFVGLFLLGALSIDYNYLYFPHQVIEYLPVLKGTVRAFSIINIGVFLYGIITICKDYTKIFKRVNKVVVVVGLFLWIGIITYMIYPFDADQNYPQYDYIFTVLIFIALFFTFMSEMVSGEIKSNAKKLCSVLGIMSLYLFFGQPILYTMYKYFFKMNNGVVFMFCLFHIVIYMLSGVVFLVTYIVKKKMRLFKKVL